ncbi:MAG TPA: double zinc ribbon domain-containing protein [Microthrixaceae bacterium]|nr:double zinc ribbon domain-containing protein [Microthrixaceae bacterium]
MLELLFPPRCALCGRTGDGLCGACLQNLPPAPDLSPPPGLVDFSALLTYEGSTKDLIAAIKFHNHRDSIPFLGMAMSRLVVPRVDVVTWAPTSRRRRRDRGYDQAELLARAVASSLGLPCRALLTRAPGRSQTGLGRDERQHGPHFMSQLQVADRVLLVDDVRTTGSTLSAAGDVLTEAGASAVSGLTLAVTL